MTQNRPDTLPLLFHFAQPVVGNGFVAGVRMKGRALLEVERDGEQEEIWVTGIAPLGIAGHGPDQGSAFADFRRAWNETLFDIVSESASFDEFRKKAGAFLRASRSHMTDLWEKALERVRSTGYKDPVLRSEDASHFAVEWDIVKHDLTDKANSSEDLHELAA